MLGDKWICDRTPTERFPNYTRANAGEVLANPCTPLGWTFGWENGLVLGCRDGFVSFGVFDADEYSSPPETFGLFGGYFYNSLTQARLMGVRMPGASPEAIDEAYFDARPDVPPYKAEDWHESARHSEKLGETMGLVLGSDSYQPIEDQKVSTIALRDSRPDLSALTNEELVARARSVQPLLVALFDSHVWASLGASFGPGIVTGLCTELGRGADAVLLLSSIGGVDSAEIAVDLWAMSRTVRNSPSLTAAFDAGLEGVASAIGGTALESQIEGFVRKHGSRGPDEWDAGADSYETDPGLIYAQLNAMRQQGDHADPTAASARNHVERERIGDEVRAALTGNDEALGMFAAGMHAADVWQAARERCKTNNIRGLHEVRMCFDELGRRTAAAGHVAHPKQIYMLLDAEVEAFVADPGSFTATLATREVDFAELGTLEPPFIVDKACPPLSTWTRRADLVVEAVNAGDVLSGAACAPGTATGTARVLTRPDDPGALEPGDILITDHTDPSWTPLFLVAGGVITNVGSFGSHASIVSRELGIPCVASIADATRRIPDGATITIDGSTGQVTIDSLPR
jgi:rifampicin phosphotransferase